ncbi:hypothetical protein AB0395_42800 [Streptosporangium sp. NPDC051023]|uniref:hypothetical protein n=1 Tax=Streptosporangium sp. NPDC051023 TaxID=3155410 RepID=UPI00344EC9F2
MNRLTAILRRPRTWAILGALALLDLLALLLLPEEVSVYAVIVITMVGGFFLG